MPRPVSTSASAALRIIGGHLRSRKITFPDRPMLRPTPDRVRETLFNWLQAELVGARCLDLFAGTGALGIEALSRGAAEVDFVESDVQTALALHNNLETLDLATGRLYQQEVMRWLEQQRPGPAGYDLVFIDPPYALGLLPGVSAALESSDLLAPHALIYCEHDGPLSASGLPNAWQQRKFKKAGQVFSYLFAREAGET